jgi:hypothetical protein|tara:strand:+ start:290 stop:757 length:468 start_codon:yes stop_codon:yes gene_type:complete
LSKDIQIARRREQVQRLLLRRLSVNEIAKSIYPQVDERTINRDISAIRRVNEKWWSSNSKVRARMMHYLKERLDAMSEVIREGWRVVDESGDNLKMRISGLNVVLGGEKALGDLLGVSGVSMMDLEVQDKLEVLDKELTELRRIASIAERNRIEA